MRLVEVRECIQVHFFHNETKTNSTSLGFPTHCKLPSTNIPNRSHRCSASSIECAETFALSKSDRFGTEGALKSQDYYEIWMKIKRLGRVFIFLNWKEKVIRGLLVRIIARFCLARFTTFHRLFLEAGSSPVLGSSMYTTYISCCTPISEQGLWKDTPKVN